MRECVQGEKRLEIRRQTLAKNEPEGSASIGAIKRKDTKEDGIYCAYQLLQVGPANVGVESFAVSRGKLCVFVCERKLVDWSLIVPRAPYLLPIGT